MIPYLLINKHKFIIIIILPDTVAVISLACLLLRGQLN